jgi:predicted aspartyl protease
MAQGETRRRHLLALMAAGAWPLSARAIPPVDVTQGSRLTPLRDRPYDPPQSLQTLADLYHRMTAPVRVNGEGPFPFIVDTGANQSVISQELAARLGLVSGASQALNGVAGVQDEPTTTARLDIGDRREGEVLLSVLPAAAIGGEGMLGIDGLDGEMLTLDFKGQALRIEPGQRRVTEPYDAALKARRRDGQLTLVDADLAGMRIVAFLDSGAQNTIGNMALRELAIVRHPHSRWTESRIVSATGLEIAAEMADLPSLRIGQFRLPNWPVAFADLHTFRMWGLTHEPAILLGVDVLSRFETVCLDFSRNEVRFRLPQA